MKHNINNHCHCTVQ